MGILEKTEPVEVFRFFEEIAKIPRPSYHEEQISDYLVDFAKKRELEVHRDSHFNVIIIKEASKGYEDVAPLILQGHVDMVCEKESGCTKDMENEGVDLVLDGDMLSADGTTLGGDDGIAVAMMLALLDDDKLSHPRLECIFTTAEEVGMDGAREIDLSPIKGRRLLNLDSETEGELLASCAGGGRADVRLSLKRERIHHGGIRLMLSVTGLLGGHSGNEIDRGRANATILLNHTILRLRNLTDVRIIAMEGGSKDNAIPREARALVFIPKKDLDKAVDAIWKVDEEYKKIFAAADPDICISVIAIEDTKSLEAADLPEAAMEWRPLTKSDTHRINTLIAALPNGILRMSDSIEGLVETSLNLGVTNMSQKELILGYSMRSSVDFSYAHLRSEMELIAKGLGADISFHGEYPAWQYVPASAFRGTIRGIYRRLFDKDIKVEAIHAGLECGLISSRLEGIDAVSLGPDMWDVHTPNEHISVSSVKRTYEFVRAIVAEKS